MAGPGLPVPPPPPLLLPVLLLLLPPPNAARSRCLPDEFQCTPGNLCYPRGWLCDGHPDCEDEEDERGCGTATPGPPGGSAEASATPEAGVSVPSRSHGYMWILIVAGLLSILVAAGSVAVWGLSKTKSRSNMVSLEKASREQLMPDKSQTGSFP
ncbi:CD320 antigen [Pithys albifrons albifrons]|uniref:CD320 antigen n=1 Tax=Pithys albifrons albifrons TaxID=3385563 RepID=UPI003A5D0F4E